LYICSLGVHTGYVKVVILQGHIAVLIHLKLRKCNKKIEEK